MELSRACYIERILLIIFLANHPRHLRYLTSGVSQIGGFGDIDRTISETCAKHEKEVPRVFYTDRLDLKY